MSDLLLQPFVRPVHAELTPPGSKSLTNRALVLAALGLSRCTLTNVLFADDTRVMLTALGLLGLDVQIDEPSLTVTVQGCGGKIPAKNAALFCGNSGTTIRFLTAMCALGNGEFQLDGIERMRKRPIGQLVDLLRNLGSRIDFAGEPGFPPIQIHADGLPGGTIRYPSSVSSQFLSAVLMAGPFMRHELRVDLQGQQTSWPYVWMTMRLMDQFGLTPELTRDRQTGEPRQISVPAGHYTAHAYAVEPDASNAAYFLAIAALHPGSSITTHGLGTLSLQGDVQFSKILSRMGASVKMTNDSVTITGGDSLQAIDVDLLDMPDQAQTLAVLALFAKGTTTIRGLHTLRMKETDRLAALSNELQKFGAQVTIKTDDTLIITPPAPPAPPDPLTPIQVNTYDDHRMAMSFAIAGTRINGVTIRDSHCVNKTYPKFFTDLQTLSQNK